MVQQFLSATEKEILAAINYTGKKDPNEQQKKEKGL